MSVEVNDLSEQCQLDNDQYLTFILSDEEFSLPIVQIKEIVEYCEITVVPLVPSFIKGVINLRGGVVPVIGLAEKFGMKVNDITKRTCIVIVEIEFDGETTLMGCVVDKVLQVQDVDDDLIEPAPTFGVTIQTDFIKGMAKIDEKIVVILDINRILSVDEIAQVQNVGNGKASDNVDKA